MIRSKTVQTFMMVSIFGILILYGGQHYFLTSENSTNDLEFYSQNIRNDDEERSSSITLAQAGDFVSRWDTALTGISGLNQITLPLVSTGNYLFNVSWGDGTNSTISMWNQAEITHTYPSIGQFDLIINGLIQGWNFYGSGDVEKIIEISQWGSLNLGDGGGYFAGATNLVLTAADAPDLTGTTSLTGAFSNCFKLGSTGNMGSWDVSGIIDMSDMFNGAIDFNQPLGTWNVSSVTSMANMFYYANAFNRSILNWDVSSVTDMSFMFAYASDFNRPLHAWDVSSVITMIYMFQAASSFNRDLYTWNVSSVTNFAGMFREAYAFNGDINWNSLQSATDMQNMFYIASAFNQPLNNWDVSLVTNMNSMFFSAEIFNQPIDMWDVSSVQYMNSMFAGASAFNQPLNSWNVSSVIDMTSTFSYATSFNQPLNNWNVSSVIAMVDMFSSAFEFNQPLENWDVSSVVSMDHMFGSASSFNQPLGNWSITNVQSMTNMFNQVTLSISNYDGMLIGWTTLKSVQFDVVFGAGNSLYSELSEVNRQFLIDDMRWTISDGGKTNAIVDNAPPVISIHPNVTYVEGTKGNNLVWVLEDEHPSTYTLLLDGNEFIANEIWTNGEIVVSIDDLTVGNYTFILNVYDISSNSATNTVYVTVIPFETPTQSIITITETFSDITTIENTIEITVTESVNEPTAAPIFIGPILIGLSLYYCLKKKKH